MKCDYFEYCGNEAVKYEIDPFCEEIHGEEIWRWYCDSCYDNDLMDI